MKKFTLAALPSSQHHYSSILKLSFFLKKQFSLISLSHSRYRDISFLLFIAVPTSSFLFICLATDNQFIKIVYLSICNGDLNLYPWLHTDGSNLLNHWRTVQVNESLEDSDLEKNSNSEPSPQGILLVVILRVLVGIPISPLTLRLFPFASLNESKQEAHTSSRDLTLPLVRVIWLGSLSVFRVPSRVIAAMLLPHPPVPWREGAAVSQEEWVGWEFCWSYSHIRDTLFVLKPRLTTVSLTTTQKLLISGVVKSILNCRIQWMWFCVQFTHAHLIVSFYSTPTFEIIDHSLFLEKCSWLCSHSTAFSLSLPHQLLIPVLCWLFVLYQASKQTWQLTLSDYICSLGDIFIYWKYV